MSELPDMLWIEFRKAIRSKMPLWTTLGSLFMPLGIAFLIFIARNPEISQKLGLVGSKANLVAYSAIDWKSYLVLLAEIISAGGFFFFILSLSWVFGREFTDGTLKDMLAVPIQRASILLAKFIVVATWCVAMAIIMLLVGLIVGTMIQLPSGSQDVMLAGSLVAIKTIGLVIAGVLPFAFFASLGRGYLLPITLAILTVITANFMVVLGWGDYFPWAIPTLYAQGISSLTPVSYSIVFITLLIGMMATYLWWKYADQNR
jgi:ABC-2 type transport system permease protein